MNYSDKKILAYIFLFIVVFLCYCAPDPLIDEEEQDTNPLDPTTDEYFPPETYILSDFSAEGDTVRSEYVTLRWGGNEEVTEYSYRFNSPQWSAWSSVTSKTFYYLDEINYTFEVKGRYPTGDFDSTQAVLNFTVDAVKGPALMIRPRRKITSIDSVFTVDIMAEEVSDLMGARVILWFDPQMLRIEGAEYGEFWERNGGNVLLFKQWDNEAGMVDLNILVVEGNPPGVDGTGVIFRLTIKPIDLGSSNLTFDPSSLYRDHENRSMEIREMTVGLVEVQ